MHSVFQYCATCHDVKPKSLSNAEAIRGLSRLCFALEIFNSVVSHNRTQGETYVTRNT